MHFRLTLVVLCVITPCNFGGYQRFGGTCSILLRCNLKKAAAVSRSMRYCNQEVLNIYLNNDVKFHATSKLIRAQMENLSTLTLRVLFIQVIVFPNFLILIFVPCFCLFSSLLSLLAPFIYLLPHCKLISLLLLLLLLIIVTFMSNW
jgi:hypothetical protein